MRKRMYLEKHKIAAEKIISREDNSIELEITFTEDCDFFDGHFPQIHLVPAVAQIDLATYFINKYFGKDRFISSAKRLKFSAPVLPNNCVHYILKYSPEKNSVNYKLISADGEKTFSSGSFLLGK